MPGTEDERHVKYGVSLAFKVDDVNAVTQVMRTKKAHILATPREGDFGTFAEITDPDGHIIILINKDDTKM